MTISISSKAKEKTKALEAKIAELAHEVMVLQAGVDGYRHKLQTQSAEMETLRDQLVVMRELNRQEAAQRKVEKVCGSCGSKWTEDHHVCRKCGGNQGKKK